MAINAEEAMAVARGSTRPCQSWHRCRRFWSLKVECPFHGKSPEEERKRRRERDIPEAEEELEIRGPKSGLAPARERTGPRPPVFGGVDELVPVAVREPRVDPVESAEFQEESFLDVGIPLLPPAVGVPLYIPDENIPEAVFPPGVEADFAAEIGVVGEEAFAEMIASAEVSKALELGFLADFQEEAFPDVAVLEAFEGANPAFTELGWLFSALFAANAVAHLWQVYNARLAPPPVIKAVSGPKLTPVQTSVRAPATNVPKALPVPNAAPPRIPVGSSGGGGIGFVFQSNPGSVEPPLPQEDFERVFQRTLDFAPIAGGGQDTD